MPELPSSNPKQFIQGAPVLHVSDVLATAAFYRDVLGFIWDFGDETYAVVWRDNSTIHFVRDGESPRGVHLFQWLRTSTPTTKRSSIEGPTLQRSPQTSRMEFASLVYAMSMVCISSLVRTSNTTDSSLLLTHNEASSAHPATIDCQHFAVHIIAGR